MGHKQQKPGQAGCGQDMSPARIVPHDLFPDYQVRPFIVKQERNWEEECGGHPASQGRFSEEAHPRTRPCTLPPGLTAEPHPPRAFALKERTQTDTCPDAKQAAGWLSPAHFPTSCPPQPPAHHSFPPPDFCTELRALCNGHAQEHHSGRFLVPPSLHPLRTAGACTPSGL